MIRSIRTRLASDPAPRAHVILGAMPLGLALSALIVWGLL